MMNVTVNIYFGKCPDCLVDDVLVDLSGDKFIRFLGIPDTEAFKCCFKCFTAKMRENGDNVWEREALLNQTEVEIKELVEMRNAQNELL